MKTPGKPDGFGKSVTDCGDGIEISLFVKDGVVTDVRYDVSGCNFTLACAQAAALLARGEELNRLIGEATPEKIDAAVGGLPEANKHCAALASRAVEAAVSDALSNLRDPWRKLYRP